MTSSASPDDAVPAARAGAPAADADTRTAARRLPPLVLLSLTALYLIWSSTYLALRVVVVTLPPLLSSGGRYVAAGAALYTIGRLRGTPPPTARQWVVAAPIGGLMFLLGNGFIALAEQRVASGLAAVACSAMPLFACAFSLVAGERPARREWAGVALGFAGVVILTLGDLRSAPGDAALLLLAPVGWAVGSVLARRVTMPAGEMSAATLMVGGGAVTLVAALVHGEGVPAHLPLRGVLALVYLAVFGSIVAFSAYTYLLRTTSTALATSYAYVNPVLAVVLGAVLGGERPSPGLLVGGVVVVAGVAVMATGRATGRRKG